MTIYDNDLLCSTLENYGFSTWPDCYQILMHMYTCLVLEPGTDSKMMSTRDNEVKHIGGSFDIFHTKSPLVSSNSNLFGVLGLKFY